MREPFDGDMVLGVRPEHVSCRTRRLSGEVEAVEYLGTTQIVTLKRREWRGEGPHARRTSPPVSAKRSAWNSTRTVTLFDNQTGRALRSI
jgi:multiple sugar transport system ATP-binding protein